VLHVCWDGRVVHLASLLGGPPPALLGALADRLLLASRRDPGGRTEVAPRGFCPLQPMVEGWVTLAALRLLPGALAVPTCLAPSCRAGCRLRAPPEAERLVCPGWPTVSLAADPWLRALSPSAWLPLTALTASPAAGGTARVRRELRALICSYDASQLPARVLGSVAAAGFPDIAAAAAARRAQQPRARMPACLLLPASLTLPPSLQTLAPFICFSCTPTRPAFNCTPLLPLPCPALPCPALFCCRSESSTVTPGHVAVFRAAAGDWDALVALVMQEWESSQYHPK
jgi:hypothetical protein